jgi:hypothetical protein
MKCPHCQHDVFPQSARTVLEKSGRPSMKGGPYNGQDLYLYTDVATCPHCLGATVDLIVESASNSTIFQTIRAMPRGGPMPPPPVEVPQIISIDYAEANEVLPISAKASAALSRRCLQAILSSHGYSGRDLVRQIDAVIAEADSSKSLPTSIRENIDAIRNFGNFSAHPVTDQTTLQVVDVEEGEAEWCLQLLQDLFDHYYVAPARASERRAALAAKLSAAGKPPMKG